MMLAAALGVGPALALMFWTLRDYTYPKVERPFFDDRKLFLMLAVGMVIGVITYSVRSWFPMEFVLYALIFAVLEPLLKLIILNIPRFQMKLDTSFYALSFGLGIGSTTAFGAIFQSISVLDHVYGWILIMLIAMQFVFLHASTATLIGTGVARGEPWGYFAHAGLVHVAFNMLMVPFFMGLDWGIATLAVATLLVAYYYVQVHRHLLPSVVRDALKAMQRAKE